MCIIWELNDFILVWLWKPRKEICPSNCPEMILTTSIFNSQITNSIRKITKRFLLQKAKKMRKTKQDHDEILIKLFFFCCCCFFINASIFITMLTIIFQIYCAFTFLWRQISISKLTTSCRRLRFRLICFFFSFCWVNKLFEN